MEDTTPFEAPRPARSVLKSARQLVADMREIVENLPVGDDGRVAMQHAEAALDAAERHVSRFVPPMPAAPAGAPVMLFKGHVDGYVRNGHQVSGYEKAKDAIAPAHPGLHDTLTKHGATVNQQMGAAHVETGYHLHNHSTADLHAHLEGHGLKMVTRGNSGHPIPPHELYKQENGYAGNTTATVHHRNGKPFYMTVRNNRSSD
jgi:hypothetical protein